MYICIDIVYAYCIKGKTCEIERLRCLSSGSPQVNQLPPRQLHIDGWMNQLTYSY